MARIKSLLFAILVFASLSPFAAYAQGPTMDAPTQAVLTALRTNAAGMVAGLSNHKGITGDQVTASYADRLTGLSSNQFNNVMIVKGRAERAAWTQMDPTSRALIKNFFASVH